MVQKIITNIFVPKYDKAWCFSLATLFAFYVYLFQPIFVQKILIDVEDIKFSVRESIKPTPKNDKVVVVAIDEPSINKLGRWPWDRTVFARLLDKMHQASVIGLDVVFSEPTNSESDNALATVIEENENVITGYFLRDQASQETTDEVWNKLDECAYHSFEGVLDDLRVDDWPYVEVNIPEISDAALSCGFFSTKPDPDGVFRHYPLAYLHKGLLLSPLAVQIMQYHYNQLAQITFGDKEYSFKDFSFKNLNKSLQQKRNIAQFKLQDIVIENANHMRLNFFDEKNINEVSAYDVYSGKVDPGFFEDKIVLIGATEVGIYDLRPTPLNQVAPGVYQHYTAVVNMLTNTFIRTSSLTDVIMIVIILVVVFIATFMNNFHFRLGIYMSLAIVAFIISYIVFIGFNTWLHEAYVLFALILTSMLYESVAFMRTEHSAKHVKKAFSSYVSKELVNELIQDPDKLKLGGDEKEITTLFTDVRNFTSISERLTPTRLVSLLNRIFDPFTKVVLDNRGMLDKYIGDAMMVLFNAPLDVDHHADRACLSALQMLDEQKRIQAELRTQDLPEIAIGIGINTGVAIVGNMGSEVRFGYTAIGDSVNLASRLEGLTKEYGINIIISEATKQQLSTDLNVLVRKLDKITVKGKDEPVIIYELLHKTPEQQHIVAAFEEALQDYFSADFKVAHDKFQSIYEHYADMPAKVFLRRCAHYMGNPPDSGWDGIHRMTTK